MSSNQEQEDTADGLLSRVMAPLRVPERALEALAGAAGTLADIRSELGAMRDEMKPLAELVPLTNEIKRQVERMPGVVTRISGQAEPLEDLLPALERLQHGVEQRLDATHETMKALERDEARLNDQVGMLGDEITALQRTLSGLKRDVERVTQRMPDPERGPLEKAREVLTGSGGSDSGGGS